MYELGQGEAYIGYALAQARIDIAGEKWLEAKAAGKDTTEHHEEHKVQRQLLKKYERKIRKIRKREQ